MFRPITMSGALSAAPASSVPSSAGFLYVQIEDVAAQSLAATATAQTSSDDGVLVSAQTLAAVASAQSGSDTSVFAASSASSDAAPKASVRSGSIMTVR